MTDIELTDEQLQQIQQAMDEGGVLMDINDQLLLAQGAGYADAEIDKYTNVIAVNKNKHGAWSVFTLDCADTRERLCFNLKITRYWSKFLQQWVVTDKDQTIVKPCTTQEEISEAINDVALAIMREKKNAT